LLQELLVSQVLQAPMAPPLVDMWVQRKSVSTAG